MSLDENSPQYAAGHLSREPIPREHTFMRDKILLCAARLFRIKGFRATTARAISKVVGILSGSLFHHFASKEQMLLEIMHEAASSMCAQADVIANGVQTPVERLRGLIALQLDCLLGEAKRDFYAVLISEWREINASNRLPLTALRRRYFSAWLRVLEDCAAAGVLRGDPRTTAFALHGAINWANTWFKPSGSISLADYGLRLEQLALIDQVFVGPELERGAQIGAMVDPE
jgi:AcrR family transcriptional regulator